MPRLKSTKTCKGPICLYAENFKGQIKETKGDLNKWRDMPSS